MPRRFRCARRPGPLALKRGLGLLDLAGGVLGRLFGGLLAAGFRSLLGAALLDLGLESLALGGRLDLVPLQLCRAVGLLGLGPRLSGLDRSVSLSLLQPALAGEIVVVGQLSRPLLGLAGHLAGEPAGRSFVAIAIRSFSVLPFVHGVWPRTCLL